MQSAKSKGNLAQCGTSRLAQSPCDLPTDLLLIHSEVSEACEALRKDEMKAVEEELADAIIRALHVAEKNDFDMSRAVWEKHYKNIDRPYRHGNKRF